MYTKNKTTTSGPNLQESLPVQPRSPKSLRLDVDGGADGSEADVGPDNLPVKGSVYFSATPGGFTYASGIDASTSAGTPESWGQGPRAAPGDPSFSGG